MSTDVTPLYDQELESLVWDDSEAKCQARKGCDGIAAVSVVAPCGHGGVICEPCRVLFVQKIAALGPMPLITACEIDGAVYDLRNLRFVAI